MTALGWVGLAAWLTVGFILLVLEFMDGDDVDEALGMAVFWPLVVVMRVIKGGFKIAKRIWKTA